MRDLKNIIPFILVLFFMLIYLVACRNDFYPVPPPPKVPVATSSLEASLVTAAPSTLSASYWKTADYFKLTAEDVATGLLYSDGFLNMTGIFSGLDNFNGGDDPQITLKAAYDAENLYILAEWYDSELDVSEANWFWNGAADVLKSDSTHGWTSQNNNDKLAMAFEIDPASSSFGSFTNVGCAASCHSDGLNSNMLPDVGKVDIWDWKLAHTSPLGYAQDMVSSANGFVNDAGQPMYVRNSSGASSRSGPAYEWSGASQSITFSDSSQPILDPAFYLYNKIPFTGDAARGDSLYHVTTQPGHCASCHGEHGEGATETAINTPFYNTKSNATLLDDMNNVSDMDPYWSGFNATDRDDIVAYIRGLCGVPGYYLQTPSGSSADILAYNNVTPVEIRNAYNASSNIHTKYQVLIIRKLKTNNDDDVQFDPAVQKTYLFGIALMDDDGKNHIGSPLETLTFK